MQMIRTTITMPKPVHQKLKKEALEEGRSLNDLLVERILKIDYDKAKKALEEIRKLRKNVNTKGINYRQLIDYGRKY